VAGRVPGVAWGVLVGAAATGAVGAAWIGGGVGPEEQPDPKPLKIFPETKTVTFEARIALDAHDPETPLVFLELVACTPDTREHESLVVTEVPPSSIHAGLLAIGAEPGSPGAVRVTADGVERRPATGARIEVSFEVGGDRFTPEDWIGLEQAESVEPAPLTDDLSFVFSGSAFVERAGRRVYAADPAGTLIGLTTFGSETVAAERAVSPESRIDTPLFVVRRERYPEFGTPVTVRLELVEGEGAGAGGGPETDQ